LGHLACLWAAVATDGRAGDFVFAFAGKIAAGGFDVGDTAAGGFDCAAAVAGGMAAGFAGAEGDTGGAGSFVCAAAGAGAWGDVAPGDVTCEAGLGRSVKIFWHFGQRTFSDVLPRKTARGIRIAAWHLLQRTRMESVGVGAAAGAGAGP
jgi:hypothetical protein